MKVEVLINGVAYPCRGTMGAMLRFRRETGKEVTEITDGNFTDLCTYLYCCVASASAADKVPFDMSLMDFADALDPDDMAKWAEQVQKEQTSMAGEKSGAEKKRQRQKGSTT